MTDKIDELKFIDTQPQKVGDARKFTPFIGRSDGEQLEGKIVDRELISIRDNVAFIKYSICTPTPEDEYASERMSLSIEKYFLDGDYEDYSYIPDREREAINRENEDIFELFSEVVKEDMRNEMRQVKPRISSETIAAISTELDYQDDKWGSKEQSLPGYLLIMKKEIDEAIEGWMKNAPGRNSPLHEIVQVVAVGIQCLEQYGTTGCTINTNDIRDDLDALPHLVHLATTPNWEAPRLFSAGPIVTFDDFLTDPEPTVDEILAANGVVHMENIDTSQQIEENS